MREPLVRTVLVAAGKRVGATFFDAVGAFFGAVVAFVLGLGFGGSVALVLLATGASWLTACCGAETAGAFGGG